jgi:hypothetical protein
VTRQTELSAEFPLHVVCYWLGNKQAVAAEQYLQVTEADFQRGAKSGAVAVQSPVQQAAGNRTDSQDLLTNKTHEIQLANTSRALAFSTTSGRSYTATTAIVDEADHVPDLQKMLNAINPTIDAGGRLILLSTADKSEPESAFKRIYRAAKTKQNSYHAIFLPWSARPDQTPAWYDEKRRTTLAQTGSLDDVQQEYPATDVEALSPRSLDKRIPAVWLQQCYIEAAPIEADGVPAIPGLPDGAAAAFAFGNRGLPRRS